jgi:multiple sugar transport system permease protein
MLQKILKFSISIIILIVMIFPIWWVLNVVFSEPGVPVSINPRLYPTSISAGINNIIKVVTESSVLHAYFVSVLFAVFQGVGVLFLTSMAAFEFALHEFPGKKVLFMTALIALMVPQAVTLIPTYLLVVDLGWLNTIQGLVIPGLASAFGLFVMTQFMENLPIELLDAGQIDGLNHFGLYWRIALPLSKNGLITLGILQFIKTWGNFLWPLVIAQSQDAYTISQIVSLYNAHQNYNTIDVIMAVNLLAAIPPILFYLIFQNYIVEGVAMSGLKG